MLNIPTNQEPAHVQSQYGDQLVTSSTLAWVSSKLGSNMVLVILFLNKQVLCLPILEGENIIVNGDSAIPKIFYMVPWYKKWLNWGMHHNKSMFLPFFDAKYSTIVCVSTGSFITTLFLLLVKTFISSLTSHIIPPYHGSTPPTSK